MTRSARSIATLALLATVVLPGALLRFYQLDQRGLDGSDNIYYVSIAESWSRGQPIFQIGNSVFVYRPLVHYLYGASLNVLGVNDTSIKLLNAAVDSLNILLLFMLCLLLARGSPWPAYAAATIYAFSPIAIEMARIELTHVISTLMVLLAALSFGLHHISPGIWSGRLLVALAGVFTGGAVLCHEELIFTASGYALCFLAVALRSDRSRTAIASCVLNLSIYSAALLITCRGAIPVQVHFLLGKLMSSAGGGEAHAPAFFERTGRLLWNSVIVYGSLPLLLAFIPILAFLAHSGFRVLTQRSRPSSLSYFPILILISYLAGFSTIINLPFFPRLFLPLFPLLTATILSSYHHLLRGRGWQAAIRRCLLIAFAWVTVAFNLGNYEHIGTYRQRSFMKSWASLSPALAADPAAGYRQLLRRSFEKSWARALYDQMRGRVGDDSRLLVTSSILSSLPGRRVLQTRYYFGDNAIYIVDHKEPLDDLISKYNIKYVLFTTRRASQRMTRRKWYSRYAYNGVWIDVEPVELGASYGFAPGEYTLKKEWQYLTAYLEQRGARLLLIDGEQAATATTPRWKPDYLIYQL